MVEKELKEKFNAFLNKYFMVVCLFLLSLGFGVLLLVLHYLVAKLRGYFIYYTKIY